MTTEEFIFTFLLICAAFAMMSGAVWVWNWVDAHTLTRHCFWCGKPIPASLDFCNDECAKDHYDYQRCEKRRYDKEY